MARKPELPTIGSDDDIAPGTIITVSAILPVNDETCRKQINDCLRLCLMEALAPRRALTVIANGPSALSVDLSNITQPTLALNGSLRLFTDRGLAPTYWACCDPQGAVAEYLTADPPRSTIYLVASKSHPSVFEKLKDRDVRVWHLPDHPVAGKQHIAIGSSVTISASWLMYRLGFTDFEYWGWDGCLMDGRHHAGSSDAWMAAELHINFGGTIVDGEMIGGRTFATSHTWAGEKQSADIFFQMTKYFDIGLTLHGDGMFKAAYDAMMVDL